MDPGHPNLMGRRRDRKRQRQDGTQTCKATCKPNAGEEWGTVASARWREGKGRGMAQQGKARRPCNEQFQPKQIDDLQKNQPQKITYKSLKSRLTCVPLLPHPFSGTVKCDGLRLIRERIRFESVQHKPEENVLKPIKIVYDPVEDFHTVEGVVDALAFALALPWSSPSSPPMPCF